MSIIPVAGINFPSSGLAHDFLRDKSICQSGQTEGCFVVSASHLNVLMRVYPDIGAVFNPHFIAGYASLLLQDHFSTSPPIKDSYKFLQAQVNYLQFAAKSPREDISIWPVWDKGLPDAMVQAEIANLYYKLSNMDTEKRHEYINMSKRAGAAFDWTWSRNGIAYGVAHSYDAKHYWYIGAGVGETQPRYALNVMNKALIEIYELSRVFPDWRPRLDRGIRTLREPSQLWPSVDKFNIPRTKVGNIDVENWSYHRINPTVHASLTYHKLNYETLERLVARGLDSGDGILKRYAELWKLSYKKVTEQ